MSGFTWSDDVKWFARINAAERATAEAGGAGPPGPLPPFDLAALGRDGYATRLKVWLQNRGLLIYFWVARKVWPFPPLPLYWKVVCVTRAADVCEVLENPDLFGVPYGPEMREIAGGANFALGMDGDSHTRQRNIILRVMRHEDADRLVGLSASFARALIFASGGTIDAIGDLVTRVAAETCARYFGLEIEDKDAFAEWAMSLSALLFADPSGAPATRALALNGAARVRAVVDRSIAKAKDHPAGGDDTLVARLVALQVSREALSPSNEEMRAILVGMIVGFIPTITLAAARMLEELLRRPRVMKDAVVAAARDDKVALTAILLEAARLNPTLQPGQWRFARRDAFIGTGGRRKEVKAGTVLMAATQSALRDGEVYKSPNLFQVNRGRPPELYDFIFGKGDHSCLGTHIAMALITQVFAVLMAQHNLRPVVGFNGGMAWIGPLPRRLDMKSDGAAAPATQTMITVFAPVRTGVSTDDLNRMIGEFGNPSPATSRMSQALTASGIVHFASMAIVEAGEPDEPSRHLLLELNVDGPMGPALDAVAAHAGNDLEPIFRAAIPGVEPLSQLLRRHALRLYKLPWGAVGLTFNGTPEFPVGQIARQAALASFSRDALDFYLEQHGGAGATAWCALDHTRGLINQAPEFFRTGERLRAAGSVNKAEELEQLLHRGASFADDLIWPSRRRLKFPEWVDPGSWTVAQQIRDFLTSDLGWIVGLVLFLFGAVLTLAIHSYLEWGRTLETVKSGWSLLIQLLFEPLHPHVPSFGSMWKFVYNSLAGLYAGLMALLAGLPALVVPLVSALVMEALVVALLVGGFLWLLRRKEESDAVDDETPALAEVRASAASENPPLYAQNHFMAVPELKPGWFRKMTLAGALGVVASTVVTRFRKGFVLNMGTIHYAQWFRAPGTRKLVFLSNYDGSWESYLEDFIMRAHVGQTAVWSNCVGYPRTEFLVKGGSQDGDRFKRWVRRQQQIAPFWYSRFPQLTTSQIRNNALIHYGLARAKNDAAARAWLGCFGTMQRPEDTIESEEVQSLVFTGFDEKPYAACAVVKLPEQPANRRRWLQGVMTGDGTPRVQPLSFGDAPRSLREGQGAAVLAVSARGLAKLGVQPAHGTDGLATFSGVFNMGMAERGRVLGDPVLRRDQGGWSDREAEAALFVYGDLPDERDRLMQAHVEFLVACDGCATTIINTDPVNRFEQDKYRREHFGFRDGISQPIIRGARRSLQPALPRDLVEPGEFIFGYPNNLGYFPPSPIVRAESDPGHNLSTPMPSTPAGPQAAISGFPDFDALDLPYLPRDFGRNGTFLVIRQMVQDVDGFEKFTLEKAEEIKKDYPRLARLLGDPVDDEWVAAKMVGRWRDGTPLIDRSGAGPTRADLNPEGAAYARKNASAMGPCVREKKRIDNDFAYGEDDPLGLRCPLGAHMRRANPRDSLQPGDPDEQSISNRHRLLRRGRSYEKKCESGSNAEMGLLFVALCADLERQFEFVQQTWLNSPSFHGLTSESDPIAAPGANVARGAFTIPTASGPIVLRDMQSFVTLKAGGYFFLPSRSALKYLIELEPR